MALIPKSSQSTHAPQPRNSSSHPCMIIIYKHIHTPMFSSNVLCITRTMASKKFLCFWNAFLIVILLFSSAMGSRDLSEIARPRMILEKASRTQRGLPQDGNYLVDPPPAH
ncbi:hypothetical protein Peur_020381 [Populus x canadensis]